MQARNSLRSADRQAPQGSSRVAALDLKFSSDGMRVRTDDHRMVFVLCGFCRLGAQRARGKTRNLKKRLRRFFHTLRRGMDYVPFLYLEDRIPT